MAAAAGRCAAAAAAAAQRQINDACGALGIAVPKSTAEFKQLVMGQDLSTEAGAKLFNQLLDLESAFYATQKQAEQAANQERALAEQRRQAAIQQRQDQLTSEQTALSQTAVNQQREVDRLTAAIGGDLSPKLVSLADRIGSLTDRIGSSYTAQFAATSSKLSDWSNWRGQLTDARQNIAGLIADAQLRLPGADKVGLLSARESALWAQMGQASDKSAVAQKIVTTLMQRIGAEADQQAARQQAELQTMNEQAASLRKTQHDALTEQIRAWEQLSDAARRAGEFVTGLQYGDMSALNYGDQLQAARSDYERTLQAARGNDLDAAGRLTQVAQAYLQEQRDYSPAAYAEVFRTVSGDLQGFSTAGHGLTPQVDVARQQLTALEQQSNLAQQQLDVSRDTATREIALLTRVDDAFRSGIAHLSDGIGQQVVELQELATEMQGNGYDNLLQESLKTLPAEIAAGFTQFVTRDEERKVMQAQLTVLTRQNELLTAQFNQAAAAHKATQQRLDDITGLLAQLQRDASLAAAS